MPDDDDDDDDDDDKTMYVVYTSVYLYLDTFVRHIRNLDFCLN